MCEIMDSTYPALKITRRELITSLEMLALVATTDDGSVSVIDYDMEKGECLITDPLFAFYVNTVFKKKK